MSPAATYSGPDRFAASPWRRLTLGDRLLVGALLALGVFSFVMVSWLRPAGHTVVVEAGNREVYRAPLRQEGSVMVHGPVGTTVVEIRRGAAWVSQSDCPLHICMRMGKISRAGEVVVCVPNRVVVRIEGPRRSRFDVIVG